MWRKPVVWAAGVAGTVAIAVAVVTTSGMAGPLMDKIFPPEPIKVVSVTWLTGPELGPVGYVLPPATPARPSGKSSGQSSGKPSEQPGEQPGEQPSENEVKPFLERPVDGFANWLARHGAIAVGSVVWQIVIEGGLRTELLVVGLRPVVDGECTQPQPGGNLIETVSEGPVGQTVFDTDIDAKEPVFVRVDVDAKRKPAFTDMVLRLPKGERHPLLFRANSRGPHCRFRIELTYAAGGSNRAMMLTAPGGRPFEVTGYSAYKWVYRPPIVCGKVARIAGEGWKPSSTKCS